MNFVITFVAGASLGMFYAAGKPRPFASLRGDAERALRWIRSVYLRARAHKRPGN